ncbi:hypothetical protein [Adlercreutzia faecimuris]|uniref:Uncharacterized protein n=1 Tax=Adlercreutzia faecimuris TaxID=2897341 RepID=A0ABS9WDP9_9ACTN|nr:hypothetical protein [Adlercreutzia sp. JBNU-10]MCI2240988.1 hypothetical protein [Adlercreutzia sp. JBNU-10]
MRKSNWIIVAILAAASAFFLWLWYYLSFNLVDNPVDLAFTIVWWVAIIGACIGIHVAERRRQERVRTAFLAPGLIYNCEAGMVRVEAGASPVDALQQTLTDLSYSFDLQDEPDNKRISFSHIVRSAKFADDGDTWEGEVVSVTYPNAKPRPFSSREELLAIVEGAPA